MANNKIKYLFEIFIFKGFQGYLRFRNKLQDYLPYVTLSVNPPKLAGVGQ